MPDRDAMIEAGAEAVYEAMPVVLKDLVSRAEAEAAIGVPHGVGVPDRWLAAAVLDVVRPLILAEFSNALLDSTNCGGKEACPVCAGRAAASKMWPGLPGYVVREAITGALERLADGNTTTDVRRMPDGRGT